MSVCLLCGCDELEHLPRFLNPARPCQVRVCIKPATEVLPEGVWEECGCPGLEIEDEEDIA